MFHTLFSCDGDGSCTLLSFNPSLILPMAAVSSPVPCSILLLRSTPLCHPPAPHPIVLQAADDMRFIHVLDQAGGKTVKIVSKIENEAGLVAFGDLAMEIPSVKVGHRGREMTRGAGYDNSLHQKRRDTRFRMEACKDHFHMTMGISLQQVEHREWEIEGRYGSAGKTTDAMRRWAPLRETDKTTGGDVGGRPEVEETGHVVLCVFCVCLCERL